MIPLDPAHVHVLRVRAGATALFLLAAALAVDLGLLRETSLPHWALSAVVLALGLVATVWLPRRRYRAWGWREDEDTLHIRHGLLVRTRTIVPFGRVTHIDVAQGPVQRRFGLATLIVHTPGTRAASVPLPGLRNEAAEALRDRIRGNIRRDLG